jgi:hypothetical protein
MPDPNPTFVPDWFEVPSRWEGAGLVLVPLGAEHNERDYQAWSSSMEHIHATPGFTGRRWPHPMTLEENLSDLVAHAEDFVARRGFTYTVLDAEESDVVGCVYLYPLADRPAPDNRDSTDTASAAAPAEALATDAGSVDSSAQGYAVRARSWVRADHAELDAPLWRAVSDWLADSWPFTVIDYAPRPG